MATTARIITSSVKPTKAGPFSRLVGSLDFKGQGTNHPLSSIDPFVLCDYGGPIMGKGLPPFGIHPHHGLIAITSVLEGSFADMDNLNGPSDELTGPGDIYAVSSGRGVAHSEKTMSDGVNSAIQTIVKIPDDKLHLPPEIFKAKVADLPVIDLGNGNLRVCVGKLANAESPVKLEAFPRFVIARLFVNPDKEVEVPIDEDLEHGYLYVIDGKGKVYGANELEIDSSTGVHVFGKGNGLKVTNADKEKKLDIFLAASKPLNEAWKKLLGHNGFIVAKDEEEAEKVMAKIDEVGVENFNYKVL